MRALLNDLMEFMMDPGSKVAIKFGMIGKWDVDANEVGLDLEVDTPILEIPIPVGIDTHLKRTERKKRIEARK